MSCAIIPQISDLMVTGWLQEEGEGAGLGASAWRTGRYHLGTLAFGSLVLSVVRMLRVALEWVEEKLKENAAADNPLVKAA